MLLESLKHGDSSFVTLTYDDTHLPEGGSLVLRDLQTFLKRLRFHIHPRRLRYYAVGEYGEKTHRPHYHAAVFGLGREYGPLIQSCWAKGFTMTGDLTKDSAQYIAQYVTKKMHRPDDPRLEGRFPEFARMSRNPGIGFTALEEVADTLSTEHGCNYLEKNLDVPDALKHGGKNWPLGRYLKGKLREKMGMSITKITPFGKRTVSDAAEATKIKNVLRVRQTLKTIAADPKNAGQNPRDVLRQEELQKIRQLEAKSKIHKKGGLF